MAEVFPGSARVVATWFTGNLIIPDGQRVSLVDMGYGSEYARYHVIRVEEGIAGQPRELNHSEFTSFRRAQFEDFQKTAEYDEIMRREQVGLTLRVPADVDRFMYHYASAEYMARPVD
jgi:hypothetical protein